MEEKYYKIDLKKVIGPTTSGTALILGNDEKTFVMFVGLYEGAAIIRELNNEKPPRPLTHELIVNIMMGFDVYLKQVVISEILDSTFIATLVLEQRSDEEEWEGKRQEVRIDARPSDCIILALKYNADIFITQQVMDKVTDIKSDLLEKTRDFMDFNWKDIDCEFDKEDDFFGHKKNEEEEDDEDDEDDDLDDDDDDEDDDDEFDDKKKDKGL